MPDKKLDSKRTVRTTLNKKFGVSENIHERKYNRNERSEFSASKSQGSFEGKKSFSRNSDRKPFGERRSFSRDSERKPFGERRSFSRDGEYRERKSFGGDKRRSVGRRVWKEDEQTPIYRQRPEAKPKQDFETQKEESLLEASVLEATSAPDDVIPPWFKKVLALTTEKGREREGNFIGEGIHVVQELVTHHADQVIGVYYAESFQNAELLDLVRAAGVRLHDISDELMEKASTTVTSQGIFAVCRQASCRPNYETTRNVLTIVDAVQDPGNLGTLFRTSLGFSSGGMILGKGTVSPFNPKVVRGSSGTFLRVPFESDVDLIDKINFLRQKGYLIVATDLHARQSLRDLPPRKLRKVAFLVGNEGAGTNAYLIELADETVKIPMSSDLESLNVAVAHGILSYELAQLQKEI
ncbi:MAG: RNA methyltransferase [Fibrobacteraceae bacterium]|jgi:TrmH family RNA methyltransferase|nr:RNA methyltransferase [Fibrobacteraceae bacterium]MBQ5610689.1 RNA methyltransferase [Fibrobacteraceae bacterium]